MIQHQKNMLKLTEYVDLEFLNEIAMLAFLDGFHYRAGHTYEPPLKRDFGGIIERGTKTTSTTNIILMDKYCKHGMIVGTCGMCGGLVKTTGELQILWVNFVDDTYDTLFENTKDKPDMDIWYSQRRLTLREKFFERYGQYPPNMNLM